MAGTREWVASVDAGALAPSLQVLGVDRNLVSVEWWGREEQGDSDPLSPRRDPHPVTPCTTGTHTPDREASGW